jgi:hypothetical protein
LVYHTEEGTPKRDEITGEWRRLHKDKFHDELLTKYIRVIKSRRIRWVGHVARIEERRGTYKALVEKPEEKRQLGRPRRRMEYYIKNKSSRGRMGSCTGLIWLRIGWSGGLL